MPFSRPTINQLVQRATADIETRLPGTEPLLRRAIERVIARVQAGLAHGAHGNIAWLAEQVIYDTAETEILERWAGIYNITRQAAVAAAGNITITGTNTTVCPAGTLWQTQDGVAYEQDDDATITAGTATVAVTAQEAGADGNQEEGVTVSLVSPVAGIDSDATVASGGIANGTDTETDASLLSHLLLRLQTPPKGGGPGDYVLWARDVSGVTRAWELPLQLGEGTVVVLFVLDDAEDIIPNASKVEEVQDYIDTKRPVTANVTVQAPTEKTLNLTIQITPDTADIRAAVEAEIEDLLLRKGEPGGTIYLSQINEAISIATDEEDHVLSSPVANVTHTATEIPILGTITWV